MFERIFAVKDMVKFSDEKARVTQVAATEHSIVFVGVRPRQQVEAHTHPNGQDTWVMMQGELMYCLGNGGTRKIAAGQIDVAPKNEIHGCVTGGRGDAIFVSIYSPKEIGYEIARR